MCGNLGDPIVGRETLEILEYIRTINPYIILSMHTNGSARDAAWWKRLAITRTKVIFGIDGMGDTNHLYRVGTDFEHIMRNADTFIQAGGEAEWHMLVFEHNQHQVGACQHTADMMGFKKFQTKHTSRFAGDKMHVLNESGKTTHIIRPTEISKKISLQVKDAVQQTTSIQCKALSGRQLYVSANGLVTPCCWLDITYMSPSNPSRIDFMDQIGELPSLENMSILDIFNTGYFDKIKETWNNTPLVECSRQCGKVDKLGVQFEN